MVYLQNLSENEKSSWNKNKPWKTFQKIPTYKQAVQAELGLSRTSIVQFWPNAQKYVCAVSPRIYTTTCVCVHVHVYFLCTVYKLQPSAIHRNLKHKSQYPHKSYHSHSWSTSCTCIAWAAWSLTNWAPNLNAITDPYVIMQKASLTRLSNPNSVEVFNDARNGTCYQIETIYLTWLNQWQHK